MFSRLFAILLTTWTLVAAPTMCLGGLMGHACNDDGEHEAEHHEHWDHSDSECGNSNFPPPSPHDNGCAGDPCSGTATIGRGLDRVDAEHETAPIQPFVFFGDIPEPFISTPRDNAAWLVRVSQTIPIHLAFHPLLN